MQGVLEETEMTPVILLCGPARSGKDTVADMICRSVKGARKIAQADTIKRFGHDAFGLTREQLYGNAKEKKFVLRPAEDKRRAQHLPYWTPLQRARITSAIEILMDQLKFEGAQRITARHQIQRWADELPKKTTPRHIMQTLGTEVIRVRDPLAWAKDAWRRANAMLVLGVPLVVITDGRFRNEILYGHYQHGLMVRVERPARPKKLSAKASQHASETEIEKVPSSWFDTTIKNNGSLKDLKYMVKSLISIMGY